MNREYKPSIDNKLENKVLLSTVSFLKGNIIDLHSIKQDVVDNQIINQQGITTKLPC
jgi:hypothetical protein